MSKNKHTPAPWRSESGYKWVNIRADEGVIADMRIIDGAPRRSADVDLIVAAPDLLEALEEMVDMVRMDGFGSYQALDIADKAIKKARGEL